MPKCKWCGRHFEKGGFNKFKSSWTLGMAGKEHFCSRQCEVASVHGNASVSGYDDAPQHQPNQSPSKGGGLFGGIINSAAGAFNSLNNSIDDRNDKIEQRKESYIDDLSSIQFGDSVNDICDVCNLLVTKASGKSDREIKKAIYNKMEFAILKLRKLGASEEADFFEKKRTEIKPKWWE